MAILSLNDYLILDEANYTLVDKFAGNLWNTDVANTGAENEFILYSWNRGTAVDAGKNLFLFDANYNIIDAQGNILLYRKTGAGQPVDVILNGALMGAASGWLEGAYAYMNYVKLVSGTFGAADAVVVPATLTDLANCVSVINNQNVGQYGIVGQEFLYTDAKVSGFANLNGNNVAKYGYLYDELVVFDDNGDEKWDRGIYKQFNLGRFDFDNTKLYINDAAGNAEVEVLRSAIEWEGLGQPETGSWVIYALNEVSDTEATIDVKKVIESNTGKVTAFSNIDRNFKVTIQIDGVDYYYGSYQGNTAALLGIQDSSKVTAQELAEIYGKYITFYADDNGVIYYLQAPSNKTNYFVMEQAQGLTAEGNLKVSGLMVDKDGSGNKQVASYEVVTINGLPVETFLKYATNVADFFVQGNVYAMVADLNGNYNLYMTNLHTEFEAGKLEDGMAASGNDPADAKDPSVQHPIHVVLPNNYGYTWADANVRGCLPKSFIFTTSKVSFVNGVLHDDGAYFKGNPNWVTNGTVWTFVTLTEVDNKIVRTVDYAIGMPSLTATIEYDGFVLWTGNNNPFNVLNHGVINWIYVYGAKNANNFLATNGVETVYYFDGSKAQLAYSGEGLYGFQAQYKYLFNLKTAKFDDVVTFNNLIGNYGLPGKFYSVRHSDLSTLANNVVDVTDRLTVAQYKGAGPNGTWIDLKIGDTTSRYFAKDGNISLFELADKKIVCNDAGAPVNLLATASSAAALPTGTVYYDALVKDDMCQPCKDCYWKLGTDSKYNGWNGLVADRNALINEWRAKPCADEDGNGLNCAVDQYDLLVANAVSFNVVFWNDAVEITGTGAYMISTPSMFMIDID